MFFHSKRIIPLFLYGLVLIGFLTALPVPKFGNTRILSGLFSILFLILKWKDFKQKISIISVSNKIVRAIVLIICCYLITLIHAATGADASIGSNEAFKSQYLIYIVLFSFVLPSFCLVAFNSVKEFILTWVIIILIEAIIVLFGVVNHEFAIYIYEHFYDNDRFVKSVDRGSRIVGLGIAGASGAVAMSTGIMSLSYLFLQKELSSLQYFLFCSIILLATLFVGRTGVLCSLVFIVTTLILSRQSIKVYILAPLALMALFWGLDFLLGMAAQGDSLFEWMSESFQSEAREETLKHIYSRYNLPFSLIGTGLSRGASINGSFCHSDSGYLQVYFAFGIIGTICYYLGILLLLQGALKGANGSMKYFLMVAVCVAFAIEIKEGFFLKYVYAFVLVSLSLFTSFQSSLSKGVK